MTQTERQLRSSDDSNGTLRYTVLSSRTIITWAVLTLLTGTGMVLWLLLGYTGGNPEANRVQLEAIRTAGTIVIGTGGAAALLLAARRQRSTEIALKQKEQDQKHQEEVPRATQEDAIERRVTELYTKAADQLGSDKAPVRLAGLYALERLAQDNSKHRQTIVNLLCAYLRMSQPFIDNTSEEKSQQTTQTGGTEEQEVRLAVQNVLADHLRPTEGKFWEGMSLNLRGANPRDLDFSGCHLSAVYFDEATFFGPALFIESTFHEIAQLKGATFTDTAWFSNANFKKNTMFTLTSFHSEVQFDHVTCAGLTGFVGATFRTAIRTDGSSFAFEPAGLLPGIENALHPRPHVDGK